MAVFTNENKITDGIDDLNITAAGAAQVDGSAVTQPISAVSLPLPTGAATEATLASIDGNIDVALSTRASEATLASIDGNIDVALSTRASEATVATLLTEAAFQARINTLGQKTMANSTPVVIASDQTAIPVTQGGAAVATVTSVSVSTVAVTLSASNSAKTRVIVYNESGDLFVKLGASASTSNYSYRITKASTLEIDGYYGIVTAIRASGMGNALVTEVGI